MISLFKTQLVTGRARPLTGTLVSTLLLHLAMTLAALGLRWVRLIVRWRAKDTVLLSPRGSKVLVLCMCPKDVTVPPKTKDRADEMARQ